MSAAAAAAVVALLALAGAVGFAGRLWLHGHRRRVAHELAAGNLRLRGRMRNLAMRGRGPTMDATARAETMWGWVWMRVDVRPRPPVETAGWSPTRWLARRALGRRAPSHDTSR